VRGFTEAFAGGLLADSEHSADLRPSPAVGARLDDLVGEAEVAGRDRVKRLSNGAEVGRGRDALDRMLRRVVVFSERLLARLRPDPPAVP
jgi:hypothetical protein